MIVNGLGFYKKKGDIANDSFFVTDENGDFILHSPNGQWLDKNGSNNPNGNYNFLAPDSFDLNEVRKTMNNLRTIIGKKKLQIPYKYYKKIEYYINNKEE